MAVAEVVVAERRHRFTDFAPRLPRRPSTCTRRDQSAPRPSSVDTPRPARVGIAYEFQPVAVDPEGDTLTFSADNLPPWAQLRSEQRQHHRHARHVRRGSTRSHHDHRRGRRAPDRDSAILDHCDRRGLAVLPRCTGSRRRRRSTVSPLDDLAGYRIVYGRDPKISITASSSAIPPRRRTSSPRSMKRHLVLRSHRRECQRARRSADHRRHEVHLTRQILTTVFHFFRGV